MANSVSETWYGDPTDLLRQHAPEMGHPDTEERGSRGGVQSYRAAALPPAPLSYMRPVDATGSRYTPSYTSYQDAPARSYTHPLYSLFNDRRESPPVQSRLVSAQRSMWGGQREEEE